MRADEDADGEPRIISNDDGLDGSIDMEDEDDDSDEPEKKRAVNGKSKKRKPSKADTWTHFTTDESGNYAECKYCKRKLKTHGSTTTNFRNHHACCHKEPDSQKKRRSTTTRGYR